MKSLQDLLKNVRTDTSRSEVAEWEKCPNCKYYPPPLTDDGYVRPHFCCFCRDQGWIRSVPGARPGHKSFGKVVPCPSCGGKSAQ